MLGDQGTERDRAAWRRHCPEGHALESIDLLARRSLPRAWRTRWTVDPAAPAVVDLTGDAEGIVTRAALQARTAHLATHLAHLGVAPGDRVLVSAQTSLNLLLYYVAALRLGAVVVPANAAYRERELRHIVGDCAPALAIVDESERAEWIQRVAPAGQTVQIIDPARPGDPATEGGDSPPVLDTSGPDDLAMICYTSGTTGVPKGAMLTHGNLLASAEALLLAWRWTADDGLVLALPLFHIHGLGVGVHGSLLAGARILLLPRFEPRGVLRACARPDATLFFGVPTMYVRLVEALDADPVGSAALSSLRLLVSGSAPLLPVVWAQVRDLIGQEVLERYGMTETIMNISNPYEGERRPGSVGLPLPGVEVRIMADGQEVAGGQMGEIYLRGPNVFRGYWNRPAATAEALGPDGWLRTGDVGQRSSDGYISIVGRAKELIISGGYNIYPREVEEVLEEHPGVREVAVVGKPSLEWGEEVVAFIVPVRAEAPPAQTEIESWCRERLAAYKRPRRLAYVSGLPRNAMGKIVRSELQAQEIP
jgi:malonyl-CoA/methylmalonyl-CoA synthetase